MNFQILKDNPLLMDKLYSLINGRVKELNYTTEEPFMPQFEENTQRLRDLFGDMMPQIYEYEKGKQKEGDDHG